MIWLGHNFNQPVERVEWPSTLKQLRFGHNFNQDVERVRWPRNLEVRERERESEEGVITFAALPCSDRIWDKVNNHDFEAAVVGASDKAVRGKYMKHIKCLEVCLLRRWLQPLKRSRVWDSSQD